MVTMKTKILTKILLLLFPLISVTEILASDVSVEASAPSQVAVGERFRISFSVNTRPSEFSPPAFENFRLISGPSQSSSSSVQIINGNITQTHSYTYTYVLEATNEGSFTIGSATVKYNNREYTSNPVSISVTEGQARQSQQQRPAQQHRQQDQAISQDDIFIRAYASNNSPFLGEQVIVNYRIYTRVNVAQYSFEKIPGFQGFWAEELGVSDRQARSKVIDGVQYRVADIRKTAVFPQRSGELTIEPLELECVVQIPSRRRRGSMIDEFFGGSFFGQYDSKNIVIKSNPVKLNVRPLPTQNRPAAFTGLVGDFDINATLSPEELNVNDASNLVVTITGRGNMRMVEKPKLQLPKNMDAFDPNISDNIRKTSSGISGSREFDYLLIPRTGGEYKIPAIRFAYFNPEKERYITKETQEFNIKVEGVSAISDASLSRHHQEGRLITDDVMFIYTKPVILNQKGEMFYNSMYFFILIIIPLTLLVVLIIYRRRHLKLQSNQALLKNKKANKVAKKRLKSAKYYLGEKKQELFYDEVSRALWGYISDKLNISLSELNR